MKTTKLILFIGRFFWKISLSLIKKNIALRNRIKELEDLMWPDRKAFRDVQKKQQRKK